MWIWQPNRGEWWVAGLFMIGAALFALGCVLLFLGGVNQEFTIDAVFFSGSIFFTSAAFCQVYHAPAENRLAHMSSLSQFIGTLLFNANTFDAFFDLDWLGQDLLVWTPNILGSILFQLSASLAVLELYKRSWHWKFRSLVWWINAINFLGCMAFLASATLSFVMPSPVSDLHVTLATVFTLIGAVCFFIGAYLMWPNMSDRKSGLSSRWHHHGK